MAENGLTMEEKREMQRRKWVRYERAHSNSMWHTGYNLLDDKRWFIAYQDDALGFVTGYGVFENAAAENALLILDEAIASHGKPASILTYAVRSPLNLRLSVPRFGQI